MARLPVQGPLIVPNTAELTLVWYANNQAFRNVLHTELTPAGPINPTVAESIFSGIKASAGWTAWAAFLSGECSLTGVEVKDIRSANQPTYESTGLPSPGTGTEAAISQGSAMAITLRTNQSGRGFVGRVYLGGLDTSSIATGRTFADGALTAAVAFINGVNSVATPLLGRLVLAQRALQADPTSDNPAMQQPRPANSLPITLVNYADKRIDSQRRRLGR